MEADTFIYLGWEFRFGVGRAYALALAGRAEILKDEQLVCVVATSDLFANKAEMMEGMKARCIRWADAQARRSLGEG